MLILDRCLLKFLYFVWKRISLNCWYLFVYFVRFFMIENGRHLRKVGISFLEFCNLRYQMHLGSDSVNKLKQYYDKCVLNMLNEILLTTELEL